MSNAAHSLRPGAITPQRTTLVALLALLTLLAMPLAALGHHHDIPSHPDDGDRECVACLWQAHHALEVVAPLTPPAPGCARHEPLPLVPLRATAHLTGSAARAPPCLSA